MKKLKCERMNIANVPRLTRGKWEGFIQRCPASRTHHLSSWPLVSLLFSLPTISKLVLLSVPLTLCPNDKITLKVSCVKSNRTLALLATLMDITNVLTEISCCSFLLHVLLLKLVLSNITQVQKMPKSWRQRGRGRRNKKIARIWLRHSVHF